MHLRSVPDAAWQARSQIGIRQQRTDEMNIRQTQQINIIYVECLNKHTVVKAMNMQKKKKSFRSTHGKDMEFNILVFVYVIMGTKQ